MHSDVVGTQRLVKLEISNVAAMALRTMLVRVYRSRTREQDDGLSLSEFTRPADQRSEGTTRFTLCLRV